jgi:hypothetical protein
MAGDVHPAGDAQEPEAPIQDPKSETQNGKCRYVRKQPYAQTPAQRAASVVNLKNAWAAPKEKIYARTPKRKASELANLGIAHGRHRRSLVQMVEHLDRTFPPLWQE